MRRPTCVLVLGLALGCASAAPVTPRTDAGSDAGGDVNTAPADVSEAIFDPGPPREVNPGGAAAGTGCEADRACLNGFCALDEGLAHRCAWQCRRDNDCATLGPRYRCAVDRAPGGARLLCAQSARGEGDVLDACEVDAECRSSRCVDHVCFPACAEDTDCPPGLRCGNVDVDGARLGLCRPAPITGVTVERYTIFNGEVAVDARTMRRGVYIPGDAVSATWTTHDLQGPEYFAAVATLTSPRGQAVVDVSTWSPLRAQPLRTNPARHQFNAAMVAANDGVTLEPGVWVSTHVITDLRQGMAVTEPRRMSAALILKRAPEGVAAEGWTLHLRMVFVGTTDINAASAPTNARLRAAVESMQRIYRTAGINVVVDDYRDIAATDAERLAVIDGRGELDDLFLTPDDDSDAVTIYLVRGISSSAGFEGAIGIAGSILGPPGIAETVQSGVAVGWETTLGGSADRLGHTMAHECGHFLGLSHTRERLPGCTDAMSTNCSPWGGVDAIDDTPNVPAQATRYLMYYLAVNGAELVSPTQALVLRRNPLVH